MTDPTHTIPETYHTTRCELPARHDHLRPAVVRNGVVRQLGVLDQFHERLVGISRSVGGPGAICGYLVCASAIVLEDFFRKRSERVFTEQDILDIRHLLCDLTVIEAPLILAFQEIQDIRREFVTKYNASVVATHGAVLGMGAALAQWIANYELADFLERHSTNPATLFLRVNEYLDIHEATPDHRPRLEQEDARFGGRRGADNEPVYLEHESMYFVQRFDAHAAFVSPSEWRGLPREQARVDESGPRIVALDLAGHFVIAIACMLQTNTPNGGHDATSSIGGSTGGAPVPALIIFNSTKTSYLENPSVAYAFDTFFG